MIKTPVVLYKILVMGIIFLFIGAVIAPTIASDTAISITLDNDGSLLGYVNDTSGNPIEGALVRVHFHETYEEDYSDSTGFYHVTNIPICYCLKNATCSKEGYKTEWVLLGIVENTTYNFVLTSNYTSDAPTIDGPTDGNVGVEYEYTFNSTNNDGDSIRYLVNWDDGSPIEIVYPTWPNPGEPGEGKANHSWDTKGTYIISARTEDENGHMSDWGFLKVTIIFNNPPCEPLIDGPRTVRPGESYEWTFKAIDPDGDNVSYKIDWNDGTTTDWTAWYPSGKEITRNHTFNFLGSVAIRAIAKDTHGAIGEPGSMNIKISKETNNPLILRFLERFPFWEVFLRAMNLLR